MCYTKFILSYFIKNIIISSKFLSIKSVPIEDTHYALKKQHKLFLKISLSDDSYTPSQKLWATFVSAAIIAFLCIVSKLTHIQPDSPSPHVLSLLLTSLQCLSTHPYVCNTRVHMSYPHKEKIWTMGEIGR